MTLNDLGRSYLTYNSFFPEAHCGEVNQDGPIVSVAKRYNPEPVDFSNVQTVINSQHTLTQISRSRHYSTLNISETVQEKPFYITVWTVVQTVLTATFNSYGNRQISTPTKSITLNRST